MVLQFILCSMKYLTTITTDCNVSLSISDTISYSGSIDNIQFV